MRDKTVFLLLSLLSLPLMACESTKEQFDFSRKAPDEFAVVKRAPLEMPPSYTLRPPTPGAPRPQEQGTTEQAAEAVFGETAPSSGTPAATTTSTGEQILLQKSGATTVQNDIRNIVDAETVKRAEEEKPTFDRIMGITGKKYEAPAKTINPVKERERLMHETKQTSESAGQ